MMLHPYSPVSQNRKDKQHMKVELNFKRFEIEQRTLSVVDGCDGGRPLAFFVK